MLRRIIVIAGTAALPAFGLAAPAAAATKNGITPLAPKGTIAVGKSPTFKAKVTKPGQVWIHVCKTKTRNGDGVICEKESIGRAHKKAGTFTYKPKLFTFPGFWLQTPGTYYWQAYRINCEGDLSDCLQEGPIVRFKIRA